MSSDTDTSSPATNLKPAPPGYQWIFVAAFRHARSGRIIRAADHGRRAFAFLVPIRKGTTQTKVSKKPRSAPPRTPRKGKARRRSDA